MWTNVFDTEDGILVYVFEKYEVSESEEYGNVGLFISKKREEEKAAQD